MPEVTVSSKGQIVLPIKLREALGLNKGGRVRVALEGNRIAISPIHTPPYHDWRRWRGFLTGTQALQDHIAEHADEAQK